MKIRNILSAAMFCIGFSLLLTIRCSAYIDPASTSYIIQIFAGIFIASGTFIGIFWSKIKRIFKKNGTNAPELTDTRRGNTDGKKTLSAADILDDEENK